MKDLLLHNSPLGCRTRVCQISGAPRSFMWMQDPPSMTYLLNCATVSILPEHGPCKHRQNPHILIHSLTNGKASLCKFEYGIFHMPTDAQRRNSTSHGQSCTLRCDLAVGGRKERRSDRCTNGWWDRRTDRRQEVRTDGRTNGRMGGRSDCRRVPSCESMTSVNLTGQACTYSF